MQKNIFHKQSTLELKSFFTLPCKFTRLRNEKMLVSEPCKQSLC